MNRTALRLISLTVFTVCLHFFGILLACQHPGGVALEQTITLIEARSSLDSALQTLKAISRASLMSQKGHHCLQRFLQVFDSLGKRVYPQLHFSPEELGANSNFRMLSTDHNREHCSGSWDPFLHGTGQLLFATHYPISR